VPSQGGWSMTFLKKGAGKKKNRLSQKKFCNLVFVKFNSRFKNSLVFKKGNPLAPYDDEGSV